MFRLSESNRLATEFDGEAFYDGVAEILARRFDEHDIRHFDWLIVQLGEEGLSAQAAAEQIYAQIVEEHTCPDCGCDARLGVHGALVPGSWDAPAYHCYGERREWLR